MLERSKFILFKSKYAIIIWRCHQFVLSLCCGARRSIAMGASECTAQQFGDTKKISVIMKMKRRHEEKSLQFRNRNLFRALWQFYQITLMNCAPATLYSHWIRATYTHSREIWRQFEIWKRSRLLLFFGGIFGAISRLMITMFVCSLRSR